MNDHTWDSSSVIDWSARTNGTGGVIAFTRGENPLRADKLNAAFAERVWRGGDTMNGFLTLAADPLVRLHAATKQYVDTRIASVIGGGGQTDTVLSFGAVGDGVTYDSTAINQAINAMASNGTLRFPATNLAGNPAVYLIDATLLVLSNSHFIIEAGATLKLIDNAPQMNVLSMNGANNVIIELYGLIDGNRLNQPGTLGTGDGNGVSCGIGGGPCNNVFIFGNNQGAVRYFKNWPVNIGTSPTPGVTSRSVEVRGIAMTDSGNSAEFSGVSHKVNVVAGSSYTASTGDIKFVTDAAHFINVGDTFCFSLAVAPSQYLQGEYVATSVPNANEVHAHVAVPTTGTGPITAGHVSIANRCYSSGFVDCYVARIPDLALVLYGGCTACYIKDCEITECGSTGPCIFSDTGQPASNEDCEISGCYVHDTYGSGVVVTSNLYGIFHKNSRVFGNTIANARVGGVQLATSDGVEAYDNLVHNAGVTTGPAHQMGLLIIAPTAKKANVRNNTLRDPHPAILSTTQTKGQLTSYNSTTGAISFQTVTPGTGGGSSTVPVNHNINVGDTFAAHLPVGTGDYLALDGTWVATTGTSGSTLNFTVPPGLGFTLNRINFFQTTYATLTSHVVPGTYTSDATGIISVQTDQPHGYPVGAWFVLDGIIGSAPGTGGATDYAGVILSGQQLALAGTTETTLTFTVTPLTTVVVTNGGRVMPASFGIIISGTDDTGGTLTLPGTGPDYARISGNRIGDYQSPQSMVASIGGVWGLNGAADANYFGPRRAIDPDVSDYNKSGINGINYDLVSNTAPVNMQLTGLMTFQTNLGQSSRFLPPTGLTPTWNYHVGRGEVDFFCGQGAGAPGGFDFLQVQVIHVASGTYDPVTGIVSLTTAIPHTVLPGVVFALNNVTGTDGTDTGTADVLRLHGSHVANSDTTGTTLTFTTALNMTIFAISGGIIVPAHTGGGLVNTAVGVAGSLLANDGLGNTRLGGALAHGAMYISPPLINGGTVTVPPNTSMVLIQNATSIASATVVLPAPVAGQYANGTELELNFQNPITALSVTGASGVDVVGPPTTIASGATSVNFILSSNVWRRRASDGNLVPAGGPFLPLIGGTLTGNLTINYAGVYANENAARGKSALNIVQTMSGTGSGAGNWIGYNNINIDADTLDADGPEAVQSSFTGSINGTILTITPPVTGVSQATFSASISGTVMTVSGTVTTGRISAGLTIQWSGGSDIVVSGGPTTYTMQHSNTVPLQAMTGIGPVPAATIAWYPVGLDPQTATIQQFSSGNDWILTTDQGIVNSQPMVTIKGFVPLQAIGWYYNHLFGGPGTGGSRSGARFQLSMFNGPAPRHANYQSTLSALSLSFPSGGTDLWSGAAGTGWGTSASSSLAKRPNVPAGVDNTYGPINYRGLAGMEIDYGVASGSADDPQYPKASAANVGGLAVIRYGSNQMAPAIWESDYGFALGQAPSGLKDAGGNIVPAKAAKFGFRFGSQSLDQLNGRAIGVQIARNAYLADGTADPTLAQTRHGVDWTPWDLTGTQFRSRGYSVLGSSGPFTAGAVQVGGGYLSATNTTVSLDTAGSVCTDAAIAPGQGGAVLYQRLVLIHDDTGTMAIVTAVDNAVRTGIGGATSVVLVPNTGRAHSSQIPANPVQFRATGNPLTFPAPGPTGPKLILTWTAPTTLALQPSGGATVFGGHVTTPDGVNVADYFAPGRVAGTTNDLPAWNAAVAKAVAMGGATITAPTGTVSLITNPINVTTSNIQFHLPSVTIKLSGLTITSAFSFNSPLSVALTLAADAAAFTTTIQVASLGGLTVGGYVTLERAAPDNGGAQANYSQTAMVRSITGTGPYTVQLDSPLACSFTAADPSLVCLNLAPISGVGITGSVTIDGAAAGGATVHGIFALKCVKSTFRDITGINFTTGSAIYTYRGHNNLFDNILSQNCGNAAYAAVHLNCQSSSHISSVRVLQASGFSMDLTAWTYCTGTGIVCEGAVAGRGFKIQASLYNTMSNIQGHFNAYTGIAIAIGSVGNKLSGLSAHNNQLSNGLWISNQFNINNTIFGVDAFGNTGNDISIGVTDTGNSIYGARATLIGDNAPDTLWVRQGRAVFPSGNATFGTAATNNTLTIAPGAGPTNTIQFTPSGTGAFFFAGPAIVNSTLTANGNVVATAAQVVGQTGSTIGTATGGNVTSLIQGAVATSRQIQFNTGSSARWLIRANATAEGGANVGTDLDFLTFTDAAGTLATALRITRSNSNAAFAGAVGFNGTAPTAKPSIAGSRGGNAALADLLTKLAATGLISDTTSA